ncbi:MAG: phytoene dehydrogenase [Bacteroidetes bacterium B1(2017)]|nr:MAG: phytoene dehydrogenase [Bacteroidetes bacterium B1(2017)]
MKKIAIIGAGMAGLSSAIRLAKAGYIIDVYESNSYPGGKLHEFYQGAYRFDAGPSLFTLPNLVIELLALAGMDKEEDFPYLKLEKACTYFYEDGLELIAYSNPQKFAKEIETKLGIDSKVVFNYLKNAQFKYESSAPLFIESSLHKLGTYLSIKTIKGILAMPRLNLFKTMNQQNLLSLKEKHLVQYFNRYATYNGSNPYEAPGILTMIPHLEHSIGSFFPKEGMYQITKSLVEAATKLGVHFHYKHPVDKVVYENNKVTGIFVNGRFEPYDAVVSNLDIYSTYKKLLPDFPAPENLLRQEKSSSGIIFYWGIKKEFPKLHLHNIFFSENYEAEFDSIFKKKELYADPTIYVNISSKLNPNDAPKGCENWFVMINVSPNTGQDWDDLIAQSKRSIIKKLSRMLGEDIGALIENESVLDPRKIEQNTGSFGGSLYGNASNNRYAAFLRHANFSSKLKGMYFCGGSVHPGGGIPLCLNSGKITSEIIVNDLKNRN